jgi:hypothetical protein
MAFASVLAKAKAASQYQQKSEDSVFAEESKIEDFSFFSEIWELKDQADNLRIQQEKVKLEQEYLNPLASADVLESLQQVEQQLKRVIDNKEACLSTLRNPASSAVNENSLCIRRDRQAALVESFDILVCKKCTVSCKLQVSHL